MTSLKMPRMLVTMTGDATSSGYRYFSMLAVGDWAQRSFGQP